MKAAILPKAVYRDYLVQNQIPVSLFTDTGENNFNLEEKEESRKYHHTRLSILLQNHSNNITQ